MSLAMKCISPRTLTDAPPYRDTDRAMARRSRTPATRHGNRITSHRADRRDDTGRAKLAAATEFGFAHELTGQINGRRSEASFSNRRALCFD